MSISILDMPSEILEKIFLMVEGEFSKNPFLTIERGKMSQMSKNILANFTRHDAKRGAQRYNRIIGKHNNLYKFYCKNNLICVLPSTLCILSRVCKTINKEINDTNKCWETVYIRDLRKGKKYVYPKKPVFYINKYIELIKNYYIPLLNNIRLIKSYDEKEVSINHRNSSIYLEHIRYCVDNLLIDENPIVCVSELYKLRYCVFSEQGDKWTVDEISRNLSVESMIKKRRNCLKGIELASDRIKLNGIRITRYERIVNSLIY